MSNQNRIVRDEHRGPIGVAWASLVSGALLSFAVLACSSPSSYALRDDPTVGNFTLCTLGAATPPVTGRLTGDPSASPDYVWLEAQDGKRQFLIWPGGFRVSFVVPLEVLDRNGNVIAKGGDVVTLQINASEHSGTTSDPYRVIGLLGRHCYQPGGS